MRGVRDDGGYDNREIEADTLAKSAIEVKTIKQSDNHENLRKGGEPFDSHELQYEERADEARNRERSKGYTTEDVCERLAQHNRDDDHYRTRRYDVLDNGVPIYSPGDYPGDFPNLRRRASSFSRRHTHTLSSTPRVQAPTDDVFAIPPNRSSLDDTPAEDRCRAGGRTSHRQDRRRSGDRRIDYHDMEHRFSRPRHGKR